MLFGLSGRALNINTSGQESQMLNSSLGTCAFEILEMPTNQRIHLIHSTASRKINHARSRSSSNLAIELHVFGAVDIGTVAFSNEPASVSIVHSLETAGFIASNNDRSRSSSSSSVRPRGKV